MAGVFHKAMVWLGLAPDDEYDDYPYEGQVRQGPAPSRPVPGPGPAGRGMPAGGGARMPNREARPRPRPAPEMEDDPFASPRGARPTGAVRELPPRGSLQGALQNDPRSVRGEETPTVRPMRPTSAKPAVLEPGSFDDAKDIADRFKSNQPVVMDLGGLDRDLARRLIDFASGICYALSGHMERVRAGAYLLVPADVEVSDEERRRLASSER